MSDTPWWRMYWRYLTRCLWHGHDMRALRVEVGDDLLFCGESCEWCGAGELYSGEPE